MMDTGLYYHHNNGTAVNTSGFMLSRTREPETPRVPLLRSSTSDGTNNPFAWHTPDASPTHATADGHRLSSDSTNTEFMYPTPGTFFDNGSPSSLMNFSSNGSTPVHCQRGADASEDFLNSAHWCMPDEVRHAEANDSDDDEAMDCDYTPMADTYTPPCAAIATPATMEYLRPTTLATPAVNSLVPANPFASPIRTLRAPSTPSPATSRVRPVTLRGPSFRALGPIADVNDDSFLMGLTTIRVPRPTVDNAIKAPGEVQTPASPCNRQPVVNEAFATVILV